VPGYWLTRFNKLQTTMSRSEWHALWRLREPECAIVVPFISVSRNSSRIALGSYTDRAGRRNLAIPRFCSRLWPDGQRPTLPRHIAVLLASCPPAPRRWGARQQPARQRPLAKRAQPRRSVIGDHAQGELVVARAAADRATAELVGSRAGWRRSRRRKPLPNRNRRVTGQFARGAGCKRRPDSPPSGAVCRLTFLDALLRRSSAVSAVLRLGLRPGWRCEPIILR
jgi:hypothetical protein